MPAKARGSDPACIFCRIVAGTVPCEKVYEDKDTLAFLDLYPISRGHTLVIPKAHFRDAASTTPAAWSAMMEATRMLVPKVTAAIGCDGVNLGVNVEKAAGQAVFHVHAHLIPRWTGDGLTNWANKDTTEEELRAVQKQIAKATGQT